MEKHEIFAKNLEAIRAIKGQSLYEFSEEIGLPKSTLQSVRVSGHTTLDTAIRISDGLGVSLDSLVGDGRLAEKMDVIQYLIRAADWFQSASGNEREELILHFQKIVEVICK